MTKEIFLEYKKRIKKKESELKLMGLAIDKMKQDFIAEFCPHKIGDKVRYRRRKSDEWKDAWVKRIYYYTYSFPMKFKYEYGSTPDVNNYHNTLNWMHQMIIEWE